MLGAAAVAALVTWRRHAEPVPPLRAEARRNPGASDDPRPAAVASSPRDRPAASGGTAVLASAVRAEAVVAGVVSGIAAVDEHGWKADLRVDQVLRGDLAIGQTVTLAWEELSLSRRVRFVEGERVLVVVDPLPTQSLWRKRFPSRDARSPVVTIAAAGEAFLAPPDGPTIDGLAHYLALTPAARAGGPGAARLAAIVASADPAVSREALAMLDADGALAAELDADGAAALSTAARRRDRAPDFRAAALRLAARRRLPGTRETARALVETEDPIRADAYRALADLEGGLRAGDVDRLLHDPDPELRVVALEVGHASLGRETCRVVMRDDPSPAVRLAAGRVLLGRADGAIGDVVPLLDDPDAGVRSAIAESFGALGAPAVGPLSAVVDDGSERAALAAVLGLSRTGKPGATMLASVADSHRYPAVQAFARLALGEAPGHGHKD